MSIFANSSEPTRLEEAKNVRAEAEQLINDEVVTYYQRWRALADSDPEWGQKHPMQISVSHDSHGRLSLEFQPTLPWLALEEVKKETTSAILTDTGA